MSFTQTGIAVGFSYTLLLFLLLLLFASSRQDLQRPDTRLF